MSRTVLLNLAILAGLQAIAVAGAAAQTGSNKPPYVVSVDYTADHANIEALRTLILDVARASIGEPGCRRFDVVEPANAPDHLLLFEVFDDAAAFKAHAETPHFKQFVTASTALKATRIASPGTMLLSLGKP